MDSENVARLEWDIRLFIGTSHSGTDVHSGQALADLTTILDGVTCKVGTVCQSIAFEAARHAHQLRSCHAMEHGVLSRPQDFAADRHLWSVYLISAENTYRIERLQIDIRVPDENF